MSRALRLPAPSPRPGRWPAFVGSDRRRSWLLCGLASLLVVAFLAVWTTYAAAHVYPRYVQLAPGAASTRTEHYRVTRLLSTDAVVDQSGEVQPAPANSSWVVAEIEVVTDRQVDPLCSLDLLGPDGRSWSEPIDRPSRQAPSGCDPGAVKAGVPFRFESIYQVPVRYTGEIRGVVVVNHLTGAPSQVLSPPR